MRIAILTLGCKSNQAESFYIESSLKRAGNDIVAITENPDLCIINTCSVTAKADQQSRQMIHKALKNNAKIIVTGCYSELNADKIKKFGDSIEIIRNNDKDNIISKIVNVNSSSDLIKPVITCRYPRRRPIVKVQDGCNYSCSYCLIPFARGKSRSEPYEKIVQEINEFDIAGYKEVVLTGIHLGTYGFDLNPKRSLSFLLKTILQETNIGRIRLSSIEINEINNELIEAISDKRICKHLHIPLQSGDNSTLRRMGRSYLTKSFAEKVKLLTEMFPEIAIGTDVITGFPGEKDENFMNTFRFIEEIPFSYVHVFPYSSRPGTRAASFNNQVPEVTKKQRVKILRDLAESKRKDYIVGHMDRILEVIIENKVSEGYFGTSANYIKVLLASDLVLSEEALINIKVAGYRNSYALGIPVNN